MVLTLHDSTILIYLKSGAAQLGFLTLLVSFLKRSNDIRTRAILNIFFKVTLHLKPYSIGYLRYRINKNILKFKRFKPRGILTHIKNGLRAKFEGLKVILSW